MASIIDAAYTYLSGYGRKSPCSRARLIHSLYLSDWWMLLHKARRLLPAEWTYDILKGPYDASAMMQIEASNLFLTQPIEYEGLSVDVKSISISVNGYSPGLLDEEAEAINEVLNAVAQMDWPMFNAFVRSTYPVQVSHRGSIMPIEKLAVEYLGRNNIQLRR